MSIELLKAKPNTGSDTSITSPSTPPSTINTSTGLGSPLERGGPDEKGRNDRSMNTQGGGNGDTPHADQGTIPRDDKDEVAQHFLDKKEVGGTGAMGDVKILHSTIAGGSTPNEVESGVTSSTFGDGDCDEQEGYSSKKITGRPNRKSYEVHNDEFSSPYKKRKKYCSEMEQKQQVGTPKAMKEVSLFPPKDEQTKMDEAYHVNDSIIKSNLPGIEDTIVPGIIKKGKCLGRRGDPRMNRSVAARLTRPELTLFQALIIGGFKFPDHVNEVSVKYSDEPIYDTDGVLLSQRKNQLSRRLRHVRKRCDKGGGDGQETPLYFRDPKQCPLLRNQLENIMHKTRMAINSPVSGAKCKVKVAHEHVDEHLSHINNDHISSGNSNTNNNGDSSDFSLPPVPSAHQIPLASSLPAAHSLQPLAAPNCSFSLLNHQQVNSFQQQQQQHIQLLNELANQRQLQEQMTLFTSAAPQPTLSLHNVSSSLVLDPSYYGHGGVGGLGIGGVGTLGPIANNLMQTPSVFSTAPISSLANEMLYNPASFYKEPTRMDHATASLPLSLSLYNQEQDMKRRALVDAGFKENEIDESLLEAMNTFQRDPFHH